MARSATASRQAGTISGRRARLAPATAALLLLAAGLGACQYRITPPAGPADPVEVHIIDYGRHASLALPAGDAGLVEWAWGDWDYFARRDRSLGSGLRALFWSEGSALTRRDIVQADAATLQRRLDAEVVHTIAVERRRATRLHNQLVARYERARTSELVHEDGRRFVRDDVGYGLFRSSTHVLAGWLEELGCRVRGWSATAAFTIDPAAAQRPQLTGDAPNGFEPEGVPPGEDKIEDRRSTSTEAAKPEEDVS